MKYSNNFERDFKWYMFVRHNFSFAGKYLTEVEYDKKAIDGKEAFFIYDTHGKLVPTRHPNILQIMIKTKGSVNLHIKSYAEDRARGTLFGFELDEWCKDWKSPKWFRKAIEHQKFNYCYLMIPELEDMEFCKNFRCAIGCKHQKAHDQNKEMQKHIKIQRYNLPLNKVDFTGGYQLEFIYKDKNGTEWNSDYSPDWEKRKEPNWEKHHNFDLDNFTKYLRQNEII